MENQNKKRKSIYLEKEEDEIFVTFLTKSISSTSAQISIDKANLNDKGWLIYEKEIKDSISYKSKLISVLSKILSDISK